jgi:hypothetical protein
MTARGISSTLIRVPHTLSQSQRRQAMALHYVPELTWILFLRILDEREMREADEAEAVTC